MEKHAPARWPNINVPPGYRFKPTPRELIQCYLEPWVGSAEPGGSRQSPGEFYGIMAAADVYGEDPGTLSSRFQHMAHDDGNWYFLSVARWKDGNGNGNGASSSSSSSSSSRRMNRAVGALGTWHGSGKRIPVRGAGFRQAFEFRPAGDGKTLWLMEEFSTVRSDAAGQDGVRVLCRLHLRPKAAADGGDRQQQQLEANDVPGPCNKRQQQQFEANDVPAPCNKRQRQRQRAAARQVEHHFDVDYWTAAPGVAYSYAAAPVTELTPEALANWQHQPMMEQAGDGGYQNQRAGVHGGVCTTMDGDEPQPLETVTADVEFTEQDLKMEDSDFVFSVEQLLQLDDGWIMGSNSNEAFSFLQPMCDGAKESNDPKLEPSDGVQENGDDDESERRH